MTTTSFTEYSAQDWRDGEEIAAFLRDRAKGKKGQRDWTMTQLLAELPDDGRVWSMLTPYQKTKVRKKLDCARLTLQREGDQLTISDWNKAQKDWVIYFRTRRVGSDEASGNAAHKRVVMAMKKLQRALADVRFEAQNGATEARRRWGHKWETVISDCLRDGLEVNKDYADKVIEQAAKEMNKIMENAQK